MIKRELASASAVAALCLLAGSAHAAVLFSSRDIVATVHTTKSDFSDAVLTIDATTTVQAGSSGTRNLNFTPLLGFVSGNYTTTGSVTLSNYVASSTNVTGVVAATGAGSFTFHNSYATAVDDPSANATLFRYTNGATAFAPFTNPTLPLLEVFLGVGAGGLVDIGGSYTFTLIVPGDYSSTSGLDSISSQHFQDASAYDGFSVSQNYVYDPVANTTTLSLQNRSYQSGQFIGLDTYFIGSAIAAVPEPSSWALMIAGFGMTGYALRRRRDRIIVRFV